MKIEFVLFIVASGFLHALYNFFMRKTGGKRLFLLGMFLAASVVSVVILFVTGDYRGTPWQYAPYIYGASFFYILYQVFVCKAYEHGNISALYPLTVLSPVFIPIWASLILGEFLGIVSILGIIVTIAGAVLVKVQAFTRAEFKKMFRFSSDYAGARLALGASFMYSFGAIFDKSKIALFTLPAYLVILLPSMTINLAIYIWLAEKRENPVPYFKKHWKLMLTGGAVVLGSFFTFRVALQAVPVSIAVPVRMVAIIFAILLGVWFLGETFRRATLIGSIIIIAGIVLVNLG